MEKFYEEYVKINDIQQYFLHYPIESDFIVLFLHGGPGQTEAHLSYQTVLPNRSFSVVFYDQRGTGKTQSKNKSKANTVTLDALLQDLKETVTYIRRQYPNKKLILLGHSWGSILGLEYVKRYADTVDAYVGMGQVVNFKCGERVAYEHCYALASNKDKKKLSKIKDYPDTMTFENANKMCRNFRKIQAKYNLMGYRGGNRKLVKIYFKSPIFQMKDVFAMMHSSKINLHLLKCVLEYDTSNVTNYSIPIYFICGENDWQVPSIVVEKYFESISAPDKKLYQIKDAGHLADLDQPEQYNEVLESICNRMLNT